MRIPRRPESAPKFAGPEPGCPAYDSAGITIQPPAFQQAESQVREQGRGAQFVQKQEAAFSEQSFDIAQSITNIRGCMQDVSGNDNVVAARGEGLTLQDLFTSKIAVVIAGNTAHSAAQHGAGTPSKYPCSSTRPTCRRTLPIRRIFSCATRPRADFQNANLTAAVRLDTIRYVRGKRHAQNPVVVVRCCIPFVDSLTRRIEESGKMTSGQA